MTDIVERLRKMTRWTAVVDNMDGENLLAEAAAEIERQRRTDAELRAGLAGIRAVFLDCMAERERLRAAQAWQPIETAPRDTQVLVYGRSTGEISGDFGVGITVATSVNGSYWTECGGDYYTVAVDATHWRAMPDPPA